MMKAMKKQIAALICAAALGITAQAESTMTAKCSINNVSISGTADSDMVSVIVTVPGVADYNAVDIDAIAQGYEYANHIPVADGKYTVEYSMLDTDQSGTYQVFVRDGDTILSGSYDYASALERQALIDQINTAADSSNFCKDIFENSDPEHNQALICRAMGFNMEDYNSLSEALRQQVALGVFRGGEDYTGETAAAELADTFNQSVAVQWINRAADAQAMQAAVQRHAGVLEIQLTDQRFAGLKTEEQTVVYTAMVARAKAAAFQDAPAVKFAFERDICIPYMNAIAYGDFEQYIKNNNQYLQLELTAYNQLSKTGKVNVAKSMAADTFVSIAEIQTKFNEYVADNKNVKDPTGGGGGNGGGSPSGGSSPSGGGISSSPGFVNGIISNTESPSKDTVSLFRDMDNTHWAYSYVEKLAKADVISGDENGNFRPGDPITRAEFVKCLVVAAGVYDENAECDFIDVPKDAWYYPYVASAYQSGLVHGITEDQFAPLSNVKRQDIAVIIYRTGKVGSTQNSIDFADSEMISDYAKEAVDVLAGAGIISGDNGNFLPMNNATRAETARMLCGILD